MHCQLDPGIDHLYAVSVIERVHQSGGKIKSFVSYCGGLPAPEGMTGDCLWGLPNKANSQTPVIHWVTSKYTRNPRKTFTNLNYPVQGWSYVSHYLFILPSPFGEFTNTQGFKISWGSTRS